MARRMHPIHAVVEREFGGYSSSDVGRSPPTSAITGRLDGGGDEAEEEYYQECMVELALEDPAVNELERMDQERGEQEIVDAINHYLHLSTRGGENRRFRLWASGGVSLRRRGVDNYRNADLLPLEIYGEDQHLHYFTSSCAGFGRQSVTMEFVHSQF